MGAQVHRLFFALRPDAALLRGIEHAVDSLKAGGLVHGRWLKPAKLHLTLQFLGDFIDAHDVIACARRAGANVRQAPFEFTLDHAATFPRRFNPPCVLHSAAESERDLRSFHGALGAALRAAGLGEHLERRPYVPHLTIAYAEKALSAPVAIERVVWKVSAFALMDSRVGQSVHDQIESWPLRA